MSTPPRQLSEKDRWLAERHAAGRERDALFSTISGEPVEPLYTEEARGCTRPAHASG
jgi:hypothetical protein